jgi:hypothetical protein
MEVLASAVELHDRISTIAGGGEGRCIGFCPSHEIELNDDDDDDYVDESNDSNKRERQKSQQANVVAFVKEFCKAVKASGRVAHASTTYCLTADTPLVWAKTPEWELQDQRDDAWTTNDIKALYDRAPVTEGTHGAGLETRVDAAVRAARDYYFDRGHFSVSPAMLERVRAAWSKHMGGTAEAVMCVPYKINCYAPDGHFAEHRDTPDVNMIGTVLVGLGEQWPEDTRARCAGSWNDQYECECVRPVHLTAAVDGGEDVQWTKTSVGTVCCFYTDVPHRVKPHGDVPGDHGL